MTTKKRVLESEQKKNANLALIKINSARKKLEMKIQLLSMKKI